MKSALFQKGFSLIETLFVVAIIGVLSTIVLSTLSVARNEELVIGTTNQVLGLLRDARGRSLASRGGSAYGVHIEQGTATLFAGSYSAGAAGNEVVELDSAVEIANISLQGGGSNVLFQKLSGKTGQYGSFVVRLKSDTSKLRTIAVSQSGVISSQ